MAGTERERAIGTSREMPRRGEVRGAGLIPRGESGRPSIGAWSSASPFVMMQQMAEDMEQLMDELGVTRTGFRTGISPRAVAGTPRAGLRTFADSTWAPQVEVQQQGDRLVVRADLPGVAREDIDIDVESDFLTIRGERKEERTSEQEGYFRTERMYGQFARTIPLPEGIDPEQCDARYENGVLEISLRMPEQNQRRGRRIQVR